MHNHNHVHCSHSNVKFCSHCNVCYCVTCGMEWKYTNNYWSIQYPSWTTSGGTVNVRDFKYDNVTAHTHT